MERQFEPIINNNDFEIDAFATRHAQSKKHDPEHVSQDYPELTETGVEQAREKARTEILDLIRRSPEGSLVFIGAASDQQRTKATGEIYGDTLSEMVENREIEDDIRVITKKDIIELSKGQGPTFTMSQIKEILATESKSTKIIITFPLQLEGFSYAYKDRWTKEGGKKTEYFSEILKKYNNNHNQAGLDWLENQGHLTTEDGRDIFGPNPTQVAEEYLASLKKLSVFAAKHTDRPLVLGGVGHQWDLDALVTYLASGRKEVTMDDFKKIIGDSDREMIDEAEMFDFQIVKDEVNVHYRGEEWETKDQIS